LSASLYELCPSCKGRCSIIEKVGEPPVQIDTNVPCPTCHARGFVANGLTVEVVEDLQVKAAAHGLLLKALIHPFDLRGRTRWVIVDRIGLGSDIHYETFNAARDAIYRAIGLGVSS